MEVDRLKNRLKTKSLTIWWLISEVMEFKMGIPVKDVNTVVTLKIYSRGSLWRKRKKILRNIN